MTYEIVASKTFIKQIENLPSKHKEQIDKKIDLIKQNPFRFKAIYAKLYSRVFRVRLNIEGSETRLIYVVLGSKIIIACLLDRTDEYKDLENYLEKIGV
ncbi:MAG: hypothetical protein HYW23_02330 [Candidatus Aenigmarchaeota archaeon]|nr:hypothetical protein [Candidatus Aenigmarchaeota archaeon]